MSDSLEAVRRCLQSPLTQLSKTTIHNPVSYTRLHLQVKLLMAHMYKMFIRVGGGGGVHVRVCVCVCMCVHVCACVCMWACVCL